MCRAPWKKEIRMLNCVNKNIKTCQAFPVVCELSCRQSRNSALRGSWPFMADLFQSQLSLWNISGLSAEIRFKTSPISGVSSSRWKVYFLSKREI